MVSQKKKYTSCAAILIELAQISFTKSRPVTIPISGNVTRLALEFHADRDGQIRGHLFPKHMGARLRLTISGPQFKDGNRRADGKRTGKNWNYWSVSSSLKYDVSQVS
jgi:hypothetical protein